jgi:hypothetical protein
LEPRNQLAIYSLALYTDSVIYPIRIIPPIPYLPTFPSSYKCLATSADQSTLCNQIYTSIRPLYRHLKATYSWKNPRKPGQRSSTATTNSL